MGKEVWSGYFNSETKRGSGGHWYTATGEARHTMPKADGSAKGIQPCEMLEAQTDTIGDNPARNVCQAWA